VSVVPATDARATVEGVLDDVRAGRTVVVTGALEGDSAGVLMVAAEHATADAVNFMVRWGRGLVCLALTAERCDALGLALQRGDGNAVGTAFAVTIEAREGVTTGISAADRSRTIRVAADPSCGPDDIVTPGHIVPLRARPEGVLARRGQAEAAVDLAALAGLTPAGAICEIMSDDGAVASPDELERYCARHGLRMVHLAQLVEYAESRAALVEPDGSRTVPTAFGEFTAVSYRDRGDGHRHVALVRGDVRSAGAERPIVSVHAACLAGDVLGSTACACGPALREALARVAEAGRGVVVYLRDDAWCGRDAQADGPAGRHRRRVAAQIVADVLGAPEEAA
jgi:3,4-dihydroxy 2-butanone 4-phosphate synthase/GTP cyclohydrolase II